jgi:transposase
MAMGKRKAKQEDLFVMADRLPKSNGHPFYVQLNKLLAEAAFDRWIEGRCRRFYEQEEKRGQPSIPPSVYFRMLLVGYFEGIDSQRGIAWRCADSLSLRTFLGVQLSEKTPDHSSMTRTRKRLPAEVFEEVFQFVLRIASEKRLLSGKTVGVDSTLLEANAAMKSIVRRDTGEDWQAYVTRLMREEGVIEADETPSDEEVRRFDKRRKNKRTSNDEWVSSSDPESRVAKMKDGRTHLAYKAEHVVDLESDLIVAAEIQPADTGDTETMVDSVVQAELNQREAGCEQAIEEVVADKGYHSAANLELCQSLGVRTYVPEPTRKHKSVWTDKPEENQQAVCGNRRRLRTKKSKRLQRRRSEFCERTFAHVCDSGGMRRSWLRGKLDVAKRYLIAAAAHNLGRILRTLFGIGKPKCLQGAGDLASLVQLIAAWLIALLDHLRATLRPQRLAPAPYGVFHARVPERLTSTDC